MKGMFKRLMASACAVVAAATMCVSVASSANAASDWQQEGVAWTAPASGGVEVYRLYYPATGLHLYTADANERNVLTSQRGWHDENVAFHADTTGREVYRLYNKRTQRHHLTMDAHEKDVLVSQYGWQYDGVAWHVGDSASVKVYRLYNKASDEHLWTIDENEYNTLPSISPSPQPTPTPTPDPSPAPGPSVQQGVTPGSFCSPAGATAIGKNGKTYTCKTSPTDNRLRWRQ